MDFKNAWRVLWHGLPPAPEPIRKVEIVRVETPYELVRNQLGSVGLKDLRAMNDWTDEERSSHLSEIATFAKKKSLKLEVDLLIDAQAYFCAEKAADLRQLDFAHGTVNGIRLVFERLMQLASEHYEKTKPKEDFDVHAFMGHTPVSAAAGTRPPEKAP